jgi:hypothetical protein
MRLWFKFVIVVLGGLLLVWATRQGFALLDRRSDLAFLEGVVVLLLVLAGAMALVHFVFRGGVDGRERRDLP